MSHENPQSLSAEQVFQAMLTQFATQFSQVLQANQDTTVQATQSLAVNMAKMMQDRELRIKPKEYKGERNQASRWVHSFEKYCEDNKIVDEHQMVRKAAQLLHGDAEKWLYSQEKQLVFDRNTIPWIEFKNRLIEEFQPVAVSEKAFLNLTRLYQGSASVNQFIAMFRSAMNDAPPLPDAITMPLFKRGLRNDIAVLVDTKAPTTLHAMMNAAVSTEDTINSHSRGRPFNNARSRDYASFNGRNTVQQSTTVTQGAPMELDVSELPMDEYGRIFVGDCEVNQIAHVRRPPPKIPGLSKDEHDRRMKERLCLKCGKPNHRAVNCRSQFNPGKAASATATASVNNTENKSKE